MQIMGVGKASISDAHFVLEVSVVFLDEKGGTTLE